MKVTFIKSATNQEELPIGDKPQIAMVGRSNVGKSTLINHLSNQKNLARVSATPGRTQLINLFDVDGRFILVDLPGYGFAKSSKEKQDVMSDMIGGYLEDNKSLKLVFIIIDSRIGPTDLDREMLGFLEELHVPAAMIVNKIDKLSNSKAVEIVRDLKSAYPFATIIAHSSITGKGRGEILEAIDRVLKKQ
ncbi:MAG: ribosome biogenesis GTP-binding protein YihA/YsxC [Patescibacteria group bacterium]|nr:ribosome biogenesis GTP-binding protein YihA/YsxC [Patescibacteria group bacterium]